MYLAGDMTQARRAYETALERSPGLLDAQLGLARMDIRSRRFAQAIERYQAILEQRPGPSAGAGGHGRGL